MELFLSSFLTRKELTESCQNLVGFKREAKVVIFFKTQQADFLWTDVTDGGGYFRDPYARELIEGGRGVLRSINAYARKVYEIHCHICPSVHSHEARFNR